MRRYLVIALGRSTIVVGRNGISSHRFPRRHYGVGLARIGHPTPVGP